MPHLLYPLGKRPQHPMDRRLAGAQSWSGCRNEEKNPIISPAKNLTLVFQPLS